MFALGAVIAFTFAFALDVTGISRGHFTPQACMYAGLLCLALWAFIPGWPRRP